MNPKNIRIVLIKTWHPGNIGAVARAMKNMGLSSLYLVDPIAFPDDDATNRAGQATDILANATVCQSLCDAISDCSLVVGTSARNRTIQLPALNAKQAAQKSAQESAESKVAFIFGRERMGLLNEEIQQCDFQLNIDANPEYPVLNLSQAVQIVCYELFDYMNQMKHDSEQKSLEPYPLHEDFERFLTHLETTANNIQFLNKSHNGQTLEHLRALFRRARLTRKELNLMRGFLTAIDKVNDSK